MLSCDRIYSTNAGYWGQVNYCIRFLTRVCWLWWSVWETKRGKGKGPMARIGRLKQEGGGGYYHCMSRVADGRRVFGVTEVGTAGAEACEKFRELMLLCAAIKAGNGAGLFSN